MFVSTPKKSKGLRSHFFSSIVQKEHIKYAQIA
ncbi:hypothetical protein HD_1119 [[Haemophilus] ducreyi 35000HP]|uniref:Uncharacterized protein n=1 Tax=Haemophilus ducreyi (strain 35000HP / ATCC 700724) TaxID=233412 RepID=Q7VM77_HAEDU|nr:hypothetical protein HD_1119 [[Haemophilus] ducreyi 35000HP]